MNQTKAPLCFIKNKGSYDTRVNTPMSGNFCYFGINNLMAFRRDGCTTFAPSYDVRVIEVYVNEPRQYLNESDHTDASY